MNEGGGESTNNRNKNKSKKKSYNRIHTVFSTDCSFYQDWQTLLVFHSAQQVGQKGTVTRIASGCTPEKQQVLQSAYEKLYPEYRVHFTPDYMSDNATQSRYQFYNKPFGMQHWLAHAQPQIENNTIIVLIDPDFIFLRPIRINFGKDNNLIPTKMKSNVNYTFPTSFGKGRPVSQMYGIGAPWTVEDNKNFNATEICGQGSPCLSVQTQFGEEHYR